MTGLFGELREALARRPPVRLGPPPAGVLPASVLVPFFLREDEPHLLFVKRPDGDYPHAGQVAFPGGKRDGDEDALACALRETEEETGLDPADVTLLGELDDYDTVVTGFRVTPVVGVIPFPYPFRPQPREVERLIEAPLRTLLDPAKLRTVTGELFGRVRPVHFYEVGIDVVWGVTAGMLGPLLELLRGLPSCPRPGNSGPP